MIIDSTTKHIEVILSSAKAINDMPVVVNYISSTPQEIKSSYDTQTNGTSAVKILSSSSNSYRLEVESMSIYNADTIDNVVTVRLNSNSAYRTIIKISVAAGASLVYMRGVGWSTAPTNIYPASQNSKYPININGNFQVAQAGTSFAAPASGAYDIDGCRQYNNTAAVYTVTQGTGSQARKKARITTITTADASVAAGDIVIDDFPIEGYDIEPLVENTFTVSFAAKFPVTGIHCVALRNTAADRSYVHEINCTAANTWASYSFTVTGGLPSAGTWVYTNTAGLALSIVRMAGTTYTGTPATADTWMTGNYLTTANQVNDCTTIGNVWALEDVRIDLGSVSGTDWPSYQEVFDRCQRYYPAPLKTSDYIVGQATSTTAAYFPVKFRIPTRTAVTGINITDSVSSKLVTNSTASTLACSAIVFNAASITTCTIVTTHAAGTVAGDSCMLLPQGSYIEFTGARL